MLHLLSFFYCCVSSIPKVRSEDLVVSMYPKSVEGLVNDVLNITVFVNKIDGEFIVDEIFWEPTISYIEPVNKEDSRAYTGISANI